MGSLQSRFRRFKRKPGSDLMLYRALRKRTPGQIAANDYLKRLGASGLRVGAYDAANRRLIERLVENGGNLWPDSGAFCAMAGYLYPGNGANLIPLKDGHDAGTLNAFVTGDWNAVTGLKGDGSTKYVDSNRAGNADGQNDIVTFVWNTAPATSGTTSTYLGSGATGAGDTNFGRSKSTPDFYFSRCRNSANTSIGNANTTGLVAMCRSVSTEYKFYDTGTIYTAAESSSTASSDNFGVFTRIDAGSPTNLADARFSFYGIGPNLNGAGELAELDAALTEWKNALAAA